MLFVGVRIFAFVAINNINTRWNSKTVWIVNNKRKRFAKRTKEKINRLAKMDRSQQKFLPNPRDSNNVFSILFFTWTIPIFKAGYRKVLQMEDMYRPLRCDLSDSLGDRLEA